MYTDNAIIHMSLEKSFADGAAVKISTLIFYGKSEVTFNHFKNFRTTAIH